MKTLFILTGQLRGFNHSYPTIKKFLEPHFGDVDYLFFYLKDGASAEDLAPQSKIIHSSFIGENPVAQVQNEFDVPPRGMAVMMQWYMGYQGKLLAKKYSNDYDYFVRLRPDAFFFEKFELNLPDPTSETILVPKNAAFKGYCDRIAASSPKGMLKYFDFYKDLCKKPPRKNEHSRHNSEQRLKFYLNEINAHVDDKQHVPFCLATADGHLRYVPIDRVKNPEDYSRSRRNIFGRDSGSPRITKGMINKWDLLI